MMKAIFLKFLDVIGARRSTKKVGHYLHEANMRSGAFMAAVIAILEVWLIFRQHDKYIIPLMQEGGQNYFDILFKYTSCFWLLLLLGLSMTLYCLFYIVRRNHKKNATLIVVIAAVGLALCFLLPLESSLQSWKEKYVVSNTLLITLYVFIALCQASVIFATIYSYKGGRNEWITSILVITLFAACCLTFGVRVSYNDYFSTSSIKQIICFLTMAIYVACLLIWKPYVSIGILGAVFLGFYLLLKSNEAARIGGEIADGDKVNYLTFFISLVMVTISIYNQRLTEARKDEELEILATTDILTGLYSFGYFTTLVANKIKDENLNTEEWLYVFINIKSFKIINNQKGIQRGNEFLKETGAYIKQYFDNSLVCRQGDDHFIVYTKDEGIAEKLEMLKKSIRELEPDIRPGISAGSYRSKDKNEDPHHAIEKARYAFSSLTRRGGNYAEYDQFMHDRYHLIQYIVSHVDEAVEQGYIQVYYQPVVYSDNHKLCGVEALARWIDPKYGFMNPGLFVSVLEDAQLVYKIDVAILDLVCKNMREVIDSGNIAVPTSINFSRNDFSTIDVAKTVEEIVQKYNIPPHMLHVEITESALLDERGKLKETMKTLKEKGFSLWLDDFGSGYSSFNTLKDYDFDVIKLDMAFLKGFDNNQKTKNIIKSVVDMAGQIGLGTLCEGVETEEQAEFLQSISCEKLQGYLFGKPMTYNDLNQRISDGVYVVADKL